MDHSPAEDNRQASRLWMPPPRSPPLQQITVNRLKAVRSPCHGVIAEDFAYADPARARNLQNMLDLAVHRGLQVIVLSCNPGDYATLSARTHQLIPLAQGPAASPAAVSGVDRTATKAESAQSSALEANEVAEIVIRRLDKSNGAAG